MLFITAVETMDYGGVDMILTFGACEIKRCVNISIVDDTFREINEVFTYSLRRTTSLNSRISLESVDGGIIIADNDDTGK